MEGIHNFGDYYIDKNKQGRQMSKSIRMFGGHNTRRYHTKGYLKQRINNNK